MRNYERGAGGKTEPRFDEVVREGTTTIVREVAALQRMVEEFSRFARLPEARPVEASLNDVVRDAVSLYAERLDGIRMDCRLSDDLPTLWLDTEQIKRVLVNLIDNAVEALGSDGKDNGNGSSAPAEDSKERSIIAGIRLFEGHRFGAADCSRHRSRHKPPRP